MKHPNWTLDGRTTDGTYRVSDASKHWTSLAIGLQAIGIVRRRRGFGRRNN